MSEIHVWRTRATSMSEATIFSAERYEDKDRESDNFFCGYIFGESKKTQWIVLFSVKVINRFVRGLIRNLINLSI
jgi:hypothetical protein